MWVLFSWPAAHSPRSYQCVQRVYMALRTCIWNVHEVEVHCPIRHASRDITKLPFHISNLSDFDKKKWGKWHFCDAPLNFTVFDLKRNLVFGPHVQTNSKPAFSSCFWLLKTYNTAVTPRLLTRYRKLSDSYCREQIPLDAPHSNLWHPRPMSHAVVFGESFANSHHRQ